MNILVSACLLGCACRYDGACKPCEKVLALSKKHTLIPFCPEVYGGLPTPRPPSEIVCGRVINSEGKDVTTEYEKGAKEALRIAKLFGCKVAILKAKSPSCGKGEIYDGTFSKTLCKGDGICAALLMQSGIEVFTEDEINAVFCKD